MSQIVNWKGVINYQVTTIATSERKHLFFFVRLRLNRNPFHHCVENSFSPYFVTRFGRHSRRSAYAHRCQDSSVLNRLETFEDKDKNKKIWGSLKFSVRNRGTVLYCLRQTRSQIRLLYCTIGNQCVLLEV